MGCDGLYADRVCKDRGSSARSHKVDNIEVLSFLSSLAGSRPGGCFNCVLLELQGMAWDGGSVKRCRRRVPKRGLLSERCSKCWERSAQRRRKLRSLHSLRVRGGSPAKSGSALYQGCDGWSHDSRVCVPQRQR